MDKNLARSFYNVVKDYQCKDSIVDLLTRVRDETYKSVSGASPAELPVVQGRIRTLDDLLVRLGREADTYKYEMDKK